VAACAALESMTMAAVESSNFFTFKSFHSEHAMGD
jgi:hypothetical protein